MSYDINKTTPPELPILGKGLECVRLLLSQASKDMRPPLVPMPFPVLGAHMSGAEFQYPDLTWRESCGMMAHLVAESGGDRKKVGDRKPSPTNAQIGKRSASIPAYSKDFSISLIYFSRRLLMHCWALRDCFVKAP